MNQQLAVHVSGISISSERSYSVNKTLKNFENSDSMKNLAKKRDSVACGIREHVRLGPNFSETLKGKLGLGARILQVGGIQKVYKQLFTCKDGEKLLNASQCYLSTTAGPIAGLLFISTNKVSFCSERPIKISSPEGDLVRAYYKAMVPLRKIQRTSESGNLKKPSQKYIEIVTVDNFDLWFMGFVNYQKALRYLQYAVSICNPFIKINK